MKTFNFDCWKSDGILTTKRIKSYDVEDAIILFENKYPDYTYDAPY